MRKRPCLLFACIFLTGIVYERYRWNGLWLVPLAVLLEEVFRGIKHTRWKQMAGRSLVLLSAFFLGVSHMQKEETFRDNYLSKIKDDSNAVIYGEILDITETEYGYRLILTDAYVSLKEANIPCNKVMVYASSDQFRVGQIYQIKGQLHLFESARNEGNFDSALFYQSQKIDFYLKSKECVLLGYKENRIRDAILSLKLKLEQVYVASLDVDAAGFYMGMILGDKSMLSQETKDLFAVGGISHILAISGLHMSMIGRGFYKILRKCRIGYLFAGVFAGLLLVIYCYMVGSGISAIRAVGMMFLFFLAQYVGRSYDMLSSLGAVVIYLLWENPFLIDYSGFHFSIAALIGVGFVGQTLSMNLELSRDGNNVLKWLKDRCSSLWMSMGITLTTLPIVAFCYFEVPLYSPLVNSLLLPLLTPVFVLALLGGLLGCMFPFLGGVILIPCGWLFSFYEFVCKLVEGLPWGSVITGKPKVEEMVLYYAVLILGCWIIKRLEDSWKEKQQGKRKVISKVGVIKLLLSGICFLLVLFPRKLETEIIFLDVGQGDGIFISSEDGITCFIDGGSSDVKEVGNYRILPFLKAHGVKSIDYWFVSHADKDHISGLMEIMESGYKIRYLVISDNMPVDENREQLLMLAKQQEIPVIQMKAEEYIQSTQSAQGGICITCLYPWAEGTDKNEQSMVLLVEFLDTKGLCTYRALFSGDISSKGETELSRRGVIEKVDLYKAAHHGSKYSNSQILIDRIQPEVCIISCGEDNSYGHPHAEVIERLIKVEVDVFYTMENGQVTIKVAP